MKSISFLMVFFLLLQSCTVYNIPATVESAVVAEKKAKVIAVDNQKYKFKRLENKNDRLIGITRQGNSTAKKLAGMPVVIKGKFLEVDLSSLEIMEVRLRNETASTLLTVGMVALGLAYIIILISGLSSESAAEQFLRDLDNLKTNK
jgi:hypothetical protein